jgi:formylglycine-generating enzyme required for sulfatase activity
MRRWFLSYNSQDLGLIQSLEAALQRKDADAHVYFAPKSERAGGFWLPSLAREIAEATVFVLLVGEKGVGPWQVLEYNEALARRVKEPAFPLVPVVLDGQPAPGLPFLRQLHWIVTADPSAESSLALLMDAADGGGWTPKELWRHTAPYRGLAAMTEADSDYFFGRARETAEVIRALASMPNKLPILLGNSGVGKSSLAQAGAIAALMRQDWPETAEVSGAWPLSFNTSRRWSFLKLKPGNEPVRALVEPFLWTWQFEATDPKRAKLLSSWTGELLDGKVTLRDLLDATQARYRDELHQPEPPAFLLYIDQGEELYVRAEEPERRRFSEILARDLSDPRLHALMGLRADFSGALLNDEPLFEAHQQINVPPLREAHLREVITRPAELLSARFETDHLATDIARRTAEESTKDAGALPLLSYLLDDMWSAMVTRGDGVLRLPPAAIELGGVLARRANTFLSSHPQAEDTLRRLLTLKLATVRDDGEPTRRRAARSEFTEEEWRLVSELADHPNRLLVTAIPESGEPYAEVAHETIFRRWEKLTDWVAAEREFLAWRSGLEAARREWRAAPERSRDEALLMGFPLTQARTWFSNRADDIPQADREFIAQSHKAARRRKLRVQATFGALAAVIVLGLAAYWNEQLLKPAYHWVIDVRSYVLSAQRERMLTPGELFRECASTDGDYSKYCPQMIVAPVGKFMMGSPSNESGRNIDESPQHEVTIALPFAVSKFEVTFDQWDACNQYGGCAPVVWRGGAPRGGKQPANNVSWYDAQQYVRWLSSLTGQHYRLLTEAEWEYAARAGSTTPFSFEGPLRWQLGEYAWYGPNSGGNTNPVGEKKPNAFGLYDMYGNVAEWVEDCHHMNYNGSPTNGSAWIDDNCVDRVFRGGSYSTTSENYLRSASRGRAPPDNRAFTIGFRVGRTLTP